MFSVYVQLVQVHYACVLSNFIVFTMNFILHTAVPDTACLYYADHARILSNFGRTSIQVDVEDKQESMIS